MWACLPSNANANFTWTPDTRPDYTPFILGPSLSVWTVLILPSCLSTFGGGGGGGERAGWVWRRCCVSYFTGASNWYWLTVGQGLLSLWQGMLLFLLFLYLISYLFFLPCPFHLSPLLFLLSLFSHSLGDDTKWPTRVDVSLNPNTINQSIDFMIFGIRFLYGDLRLIYKNVKFNENVCLLNLISVLKSITKTRLYNFDPLKPHFYIVKLGFTGVCIILFLLET